MLPQQFRAAHCWLTFFGAGIFPALLAAGEPSREDIELVAKVAAKYFEISPQVEGWAWPPLVCIADSPEVNAFASVGLLRPGEKPVVRPYSNVVWVTVPYDDGSIPDAAQAANNDTSDQVTRPQPYIYIIQGFLNEIVQGRENYFAETFGHELSHIVLRHRENYGDGDAPLVGNANKRRLEADADILGMKLSLRAGYAYRDIVEATKAWRDYEQREIAAGKRKESSSLSALLNTHPGWTERAALIDERQAELWHSIGAFETGVYLLLAENYSLAERCFSQVIKDAPQCYEAFANRGYARLMRYCDELDPADLQEMGLGQLVAGGFYHRADSLERGFNEELWQYAVRDLREALRLKATLILPQAHLALAQLVHPAGGKTAEAARLFEQIIETIQQPDFTDKLGPLDVAALYVNAGVTELANGKADAAAKYFQQAGKLNPQGAAKNALLYNHAVQLAGSQEAEQRQQGAAKLEEYLTTTSPSSAWWELAYQRYQQVCQSEAIDSKPKTVFAQENNLHIRPIESVTLRDGHEIVLNESLSAVQEFLGEGKRIPVVLRTNIHRRRYPNQGIELLCIDRVLAIRLQNSQAPPLKLQPRGAGGKPREVRVGMKFAELQNLLGGDQTAWDKRYGTQTSKVYHYFERLSFGVEVTAEGTISEIIVAQIPEEARIENRPSAR